MCVYISTFCPGSTFLDILALHRVFNALPFFLYISEFYCPEVKHFLTLVITKDELF